MSERIYILHLDSQQHRDRFLTAIASLSGFVCFGSPERQRQARRPWLSALPSRRFSDDRLTSAATLTELERISSGLSKGQRIAGVFEYEAGYELERALTRFAPGTTQPPIRAAVYDWFLSPCHQSDRNIEVHESALCPPEVSKKLNQILEESRAAHAQNTLRIDPFRQEQPQASYEAKVATVLEYILAGDCYQVNLSHRFQSRFEGDLWQAYRHLVRRFPTDHAAYLNIDGDPVLSISPESFLEISQGKVVTRPIKGTRPRGKSEEEDSRLANELEASIKDRAENIMIVDLLRNDLGRFCTSGSITAKPLLTLESYRNVHHLVSTVTGELDPKTPPVRALACGFPGGSITGAPKIRAMEIIHELETSPRGPYCGSVFSLDDHGDLYSNIAIRTLYARGNELFCHGGGGVVADSVPSAEFQETLDKVGPLMEELVKQFGPKTSP
ncbi:aminodeoxychorismate synthase component I [Marinobacter mobilis]|uniref:aminodeoxychorismate synthase component I n=1 Tax=Marinobacter mobilis TaxID=488533 RepID=UPI0035C7033B